MNYRKRKAIKPKDQFSNMPIIAVLTPGHAYSRPKYMYRSSIARRDDLGQYVIIYIYPSIIPLVSHSLSLSLLTHLFTHSRTHTHACIHARMHARTHTVSQPEGQTTSIASSNTVRVFTGTPLPLPIRLFAVHPPVRPPSLPSLPHARHPARPSFRHPVSQSVSKSVTQ